MNGNKIQQDGCYITKTDYTNKKCLVLESPWQDSFESILIEKNIDHIRLSEHSGWHEEKIDFIKKIPFLSGIEIYSKKVKDIKPIAILTGLKYLAIDCPYKEIDLSCFTELEHLLLRFRKKTDGIYSLNNLVLINIINFPEINLEKLSNMPNLSDIKITSKILASLHGAEKILNLSSIDLFSCPNLSTLDNIGKCNNLATLDIENCKNIYNIEPIKNNLFLKRISINNCMDIESLYPLNGFEFLEEIILLGNTNVADGNLSFLCSLPSLKNTIFSDRKNYSIKREAITYNV